MDLYNGEIVAYETSKRPVFNLVSAMLKKVFRHISPEQKPMLHSDQGWQYQQPVYRRMLARSEEHTSELQSLMRNSYAVFCLKKKKRRIPQTRMVRETQTANTHIDRRQ